MSTRLLRATAAATLLLVIGATAVAAGGWATIVADDATPPAPRAGEDVEYGFTVLQHGVTPADFEDPTLRLTNTITGESFDVPAEPSGPAGHFVARFSFPSAGSWSYGVQLRDLAVETGPVTATVLEAAGPSEVPPLLIVALAVLGGTLAGLAVVWLRRRRAPVAVEGDATPSGRPLTT